MSPEMQARMPKPASTLPGFLYHRVDILLKNDVHVATARPTLALAAFQN